MNLVVSFSSDISWVEGGWVNEFTIVVFGGKVSNYGLSDLDEVGDID